MDERRVRMDEVQGKLHRARRIVVYTLSFSWLGVLAWLTFKSRVVVRHSGGQGIESIWDWLRLSVATPSQDQYSQYQVFLIRHADQAVFVLATLIAVSAILISLYRFLLKWEEELR